MNQTENFQKIFIGGLNLKTNEDTLRATFEKYGNIVDCVVMRDNATHKSRGFGFVTFDEQSAVDNAMSERPHTVDGKEVDSKRAVPRQLQGKPDAYITVDKLFVGGIKDDTTEEMLSEYFSTYGNVAHVDVKKDHTTGKPRGFAFVTFDDHDPVDKALLFDHHVINNHKVELRKALNRNEITSINGKTAGPMSNSGRGRGRGRGSSMSSSNMPNNYGYNNMDMMSNFMGGCFPDQYNSMNQMGGYPPSDMYNKPKMGNNPRQQMPYPNQMNQMPYNQMWGDGMNDPMMSQMGNMQMPPSFGDFGTNYGGAQPGSIKPGKNFMNRSTNPYNNQGGNRNNGL